MYVGLGPKILAVCVDHFSSSILSDYIQFNESSNADSKDSDLEM